MSDEVEHVKLDEPWPHLGSLIAVESVRDVGGVIGTERRYYVSSLTGTDATRAAGLVRGHWSVENNLHWQLDVTFREDACRVRTGHAAENLSRLRLRRMALNRIKQHRDQGQRARQTPAGRVGQLLPVQVAHDLNMRLPCSCVPLPR